MRIQFSATGDKRVVAAFERVDQGARNSSQGLDGFRGGLLSIDAAMGIASQSLGALQTAFDALRVPVGLAVDWEKQFAQIKTLNASIGADLEQQLLDLAGRVPQTAGDIAQSAYSAISAGIDPTQVVDFLEAASKAAVAGSSTMAEATTALTKTLAGFKQQGLDSTRAMDVLFATVKRGDTNFTDLASSVGMVAGAAGTAGATVEEMGAAIATLSKSAPNTAIAVTNLNAVLKVLTKPTVQSKKAFDALGVEVGALAVKQKGLIPILEEISAAVGDDVEKLNSLTNSTEAQAGFNALLSGSMKELRADYEEVKNSTGALSDANEILAGTTQNAIDNFNALTESALREIGQEILPDINRGLREFGEWWEGNGKSVISTIKGIYQAAKLMFEAFKTGGGLAPFAADLAALSGGMRDLAESMGLVPPRVEEIADAFADARKEAEKFTAAQRKDAEVFIRASEDAVKAAIKRGDTVVAQRTREAQVEALRVRHMQQETETLQRYYRIQALEQMKAEAAAGAFGELRVERINQELDLMRIRQNEALKDNDTVLEAMRNLQDLNVKAEIAAERAKKRVAKTPRATGAARAPRQAAPQTGFISEAIDELVADTERKARESVERRFAFEADLWDRQIDLIDDEGNRRILALATAHAREMEQARSNGMDLNLLRITQEQELSGAIEEINEERRKRDAERFDEWASNFRQGTAETLTAIEQIAAGAEAIGISGDAAQKALAYTRALVSAADAISYGAQSAAAFARYDLFAGFKFGAASIGSTAAAVAYFKAAGKGGAASPSTATGGGGGASAVAAPARASEADLGRRSSSSSGPTTLTYQLNFNAPVFDTKGNVDRAIAEAARRQQKAPGGVSILTPSEIKRAARA